MRSDIKKLNKLLRNNYYSTNETGDQEESINDYTNTITRPEDISQVPVITYDKASNSGKTKRKSGRSGKTAIITSSPYVKELKENQEIKELNEEIKLLKQDVRRKNKDLKNEKALASHRSRRSMH